MKSYKRKESAATSDHRSLSNTSNHLIKRCRFTAALLPPASASQSPVCSAGSKASTLLSSTTENLPSRSSKKEEMKKVSLIFRNADQLASMERFAEQYADNCNSMKMENFAVDIAFLQQPSVTQKLSSCLTHLTSLTIRNCELSSFPALAIQSVSEHLILLDLSNNKLTSVPFGTMLCLNKLVTLDLSHNSLASLPGDMWFAPLRQIFINSNNAYCLPPVSFKPLFGSPKASIFILNFDSKIKIYPIELLSMQYTQLTLSSASDTMLRDKFDAGVSVAQPHAISIKFDTPVKCNRVLSLEKLVVQYFAERFSDSVRYNLPEILYSLFDGMRQCVVCGRLLPKSNCGYSGEIMVEKGNSCFRARCNVFTFEKTSRSYADVRDTFSAAFCMHHIDSNNGITSFVGRNNKFRSVQQLSDRIASAASVPLNMRTLSCEPAIALRVNSERSSNSSNVGAFGVPTVYRRQQT